MTFYRNLNILCKGQTFYTVLKYKNVHEFFNQNKVYLNVVEYKIINIESTIIFKFPSQETNLFF